MYALWCLSHELKCVRLILSDQDRALLDQSQCQLTHFDIIVPGSKYPIILVYRPPSTSIEQTKLFIATKSLVDLSYNLSHPL